MSKILEFLDKYEKKKIQDSKDDISTSRRVWDKHYYTFSLNLRECFPGMMTLGMPNGYSLIELDDEDLEYLYNKYSKLKKSELADKRKKEHLQEELAKIDAEARERKEKLRKEFKNELDKKTI